MEKVAPKNCRRAEIRRKTTETDIFVSVNLDGSGNYDIHTGIGFFDHMLEGFARHGLFDLKIQADGDLETGSHHTIEDTGIVLGCAIKEALGDKKGIRRYGSSILPMDETLVMTAVDFCGRAYFSFEGEFTVPKIADMESEMIREFFYAVASNCSMNLHMKILDGFNNHHKAEALFKSFAKSVDEAVTIDPRIRDLLSTKGSL